MKISFFEEFPDRENLEKADLIDFPTKIYIASNGISEFNRIKINSRFVKDKIYWPLLRKEEGYWLSPWAKREAIKRVINEIENNNSCVLWDAEYPSINKKLLLTEMHNFFGNKSLIEGFMRRHGKNVYAVEYAFPNRIAKKLLGFAALDFDPKIYGNTIIKMVYSSIHHFSEEFKKDTIQDGISEWGDRFAVGLGVIAKGIHGNEHLLKPEDLEKDLRLCKKVNEVIIFRLGGLNKDYIKVIKKFV